MSSIDQIYLPNPVQPGKNSQAVRLPGSAQSVDSPFSRVLEQAGGVRFSSHAQERLKARNISFTQEQMQQIEGAVNSVAQKGGKDSLVMVGDAALVVSIKNRTVVTAMDRQQMKGNVFTNIDSAVVL